MGIVLSSAAGNFSDIGPKVLLEPVFGLGTGIQYVAAAVTIAEKRQRIATLAAFLAASTATVTINECSYGRCYSIKNCLHAGNPCSRWRKFYYNKRNFFVFIVIPDAGKP